MPVQQLDHLPTKDEKLLFLSPKLQLIRSKGFESENTFEVRYAHVSPIFMAIAVIVGLSIMTAVMMDAGLGSLQWIIIGFFWFCGLTMVPIFVFFMRQVKASMETLRLRVDRASGLVSVANFDTKLPLAGIRQIIVVEGLYRGLARGHWISELSIVAEHNGHLIRVPVLMMTKWTTNKIAKRLTELTGAHFTIHEPVRPEPLGCEVEMQKGAA